MCKWEHTVLVGTSCVQMSNACTGENKPYASGNTLCRWEQAVCRCQNCVQARTSCLQIRTSCGQVRTRCSMQVGTSCVQMSKVVYR